MRRVVVTGLGAVTPIGADAPSTWRAAVAGESGIDFISSFDGSHMTLLLMTFAVVILILLFTYRSPVLWLLPIFSAMVASRSAI